MPEYRLFPSSYPPNLTSNDGQAVNLGQGFRVTDPCRVTKVWFYRAATTVNPTNARIYRVLDLDVTYGELLAEVTPIYNGLGWQSTELPEPLEVYVAWEYRVVFYYPNGSEYTTATGNYFTNGGGSGGITNGLIWTPAAGGAGFPGGITSFRYGALAFPDDTYQGNNYWLDVSIEPLQNEYRMWSSSDVPSYTPDSGDVNLGVEFYVTSKSWLKRVHYYHPNNSGMTAPEVTLWQMNSPSTGTPIGGVSLGAFDQPMLHGWQTFSLATPIELVPNQHYKLSGLFTNNYPSAQNFWSSGPGGGGLSSGPLRMPDHASSLGGQGTFLYGGTIAFPTQMFMTSNYWIDVSITDVDPFAGPPTDGFFGLLG